MSVVGGGDLQAPRLGRGVNLAGYFRSVMGIGAVARGLVDALESQGISVSPVGLIAGGLDEHGDETPGGHAAAPIYPINLICVNAQGVPVFVDRMGPAFFEGRHSVGVWWWEVDAFPRRWLSAFDHVDEVWAGSNHVAAVLSAVSPVPVVKITTPVTVPPIDAPPRQSLGVPEGFVYLFMFDYNSVFNRKNPLGVVSAFTRAFDPGEGASLVLKCIGQERFAADHERLRAAASEHPDIHIVDRPLPSAEKNALVAACDCYVSLHRAEGFGLPLAEAMALGKPVIATGYSGNLDFMTPENSWLVDYSLVPIGEGSEPYPAQGVWAEPDIEHAARQMRAVHDDPGAASVRAERGRRDLERGHSLEAAGETMARRLALIGERWGERDPTEAMEEPASAEVARRISEGPMADPGLGAARKAVRGLALRATRPLAVHERRVDEELLRAVRALERRVEALAAGHAQLREQLASVLAAQRSSPEGASALLEHPVAGVVRGYSGQNVASPGATPAPAPALPDGRYDALIADRDPRLEIEGDPAELDSAADASLGAVIARGIVERLAPDRLAEFFTQARSKLQEPGLLLVEALNPSAVGSGQARSGDPAHVRPLAPEAALALCQEAGFASAFVFYPGGAGNFESDRASQPVYALVAATGPDDLALRGPEDLF